MASMASSEPSTVPETVSSSSSLVTRRWPGSWPAASPSSPMTTPPVSGHVGPGAIHLLTGLYDAKMDHQPVVAIVGQNAYVPRCLLSTGGRPSVAVQGRGRRFRAVAMVPEQIRHLVDRAMRTALSERTVACLISRTTCRPSTPSKAPQHGAVFSGTSFTRHRPVPSPEDLAKAADILNAGERVAMLVGAGAWAPLMR